LFDLKRFIDKFKQKVNIDEIIRILEKLPQDPSLQQVSQNAGFVGGILKVGLEITEKVYEAKVPLHTRLSFTLMRIMLESANDSLKLVSSSNAEKILGEDRDSKGIEDAVIDSARPLESEEASWNYLPDHPIISRFRDQLKVRVSEYNSKFNSNVNVPLLLTEFNSNVIIKAEEEKDKNDEFKNLLHKWKVSTNYLGILKYLKSAKNLFLEPNKLDSRALSEYYVENKAYLVDKKYWDIEEDQIKKKRLWNIESFLTGNKNVEIIAAPFGIGKSSLGKKIVYEYATKSIHDPTDEKSFIPIFVPLK